MLASFDQTYRGKPLQNWLGQHPAFNEGYRSEHNILYTEMQAAETFSMSPNEYFDSGRENRMAMVAYVIGKGAVQTMQAYDEQKRAEAKAKKKGK